MSNREDYEPEEWADMVERFADPGGKSTRATCPAQLATRPTG